MAQGVSPELGAASTPPRSMRERYEASRAARRRRFSSAVALRARSAGVARGSAHCAFVVPSTAKGKVLRGTISVRTGGKFVARNFAFVVR